MRKYTGPFYKKKTKFNLIETITIILVIFILLSWPHQGKAQYPFDFSSIGSSPIFNPLSPYMYNYNDYSLPSYNYGQANLFSPFNSMYPSVVSFPSPFSYGKSPYGGPNPSQEYYNYVYGTPPLFGGNFGNISPFTSWAPWLRPSFSYIPPGSLLGYTPQIPPYISFPNRNTPLGGDKFIPLPPSSNKNIPSPSPQVMSGTWKSEHWPQYAGHPISGSLELNRGGDNNSIKIEDHVGEGTLTSYNYTPTIGEAPISFTAVFETGGTASFNGTANNSLCPQNVFCFWSGSFTVEGTYRIKDSAGHLIDEGTFILNYPE